MLQVFVCEDNEIQRQEIVQLIENVILMDELDMKMVLQTDDPQAVLEHIHESKDTGVYFLDIDLGSDMNGMQLAQHIRELDPRCFIIFVTAHSELSFMTFQYKVEAMDFVLKDNREEARVKIKECLLKALERHGSQRNKSSRTFPIEVGSRKLHISCDDILFFETSDNIHKIILHAKDRQIEFTGTMKQVEQMLDDRFVRCHRSFIVNKQHIKEVNRKERTVELDNGEVCLLSVRMMRNV